MTGITSLKLSTRVDKTNELSFIKKKEHLSILIIRPFDYDKNPSIELAENTYTKGTT